MDWPNCILCTTFCFLEGHGIFKKMHTCFLIGLAFWPNELGNVFWLEKTGLWLPFGPI